MHWTREHEIVALDLYCHIPFQKATNSNSDIIRVAKMLGRSVNSVKMKIGNFGSFDPELSKLGISGLTGTSKLDEEVWTTYYKHWDKLAYDAQQIMANYTGKSIEETAGLSTMIIPNGKEREQLIKTRINQSFFRSAVLSSYSSRCCMTGINNPQLLEAAHIVSWAEDEANRTNPSNGLCLNVLMHCAYDKLLVSVSPDYEICVADSLIVEEKNNTNQIEFFQKVCGRKIIKPNRFLPDKDLLALQYERFVNKWGSNVIPR